MKEYLKEIFTSVRDIMLKMILNSQVSKVNIVIYSNELGQKLHEYRHVQERYVYLTNLKCDI